MGVEHEPAAEVRARFAAGHEVADAAAESRVYLWVSSSGTRGKGRSDGQQSGRKPGADAEAYWALPPMHSGS